MKFKILIITILLVCSLFIISCTTGTIGSNQTEEITDNKIVPVDMNNAKLTVDECAQKSGRVIQPSAENNCEDDEQVYGEVQGFVEQNICCIPLASKSITLEEIFEIVKDSECPKKGYVSSLHNYNSNSKTWWIDMEMNPEFEKEGCSPACVVSEETKTAEINWRCTGAINE
ncbi:hypothetical protein HOK51_11350 [Candidatus Woesearchaeota archaeon]|jgi:hypothetical protein|nr:hypothetical protein [Candidatus Woesearchaeota archaeon]MBT7368824.1 hypothetical protein [Candidatus Woesearchaeota archaeon]